MKDWLAANWHWLLFIALAVYAMNQHAAVRAEKEKGVVVAENARLLDVARRTDEKVAQLEAQVAGLQAEKAELKGQIAANQEDIAELEEQRDTNRLTVRKLTREGDVLAVFAETFPEIAAANNFGFTEIFDENEGVKVLYLAVPAAHAKTFVNEHRAMESFRAQISEFHENERLYGDVVALSEQVEDLEAQAKTAYRDGRNECEAARQALVDKHIEVLSRPRLEFPGGWTVSMCALGALAAGAGGVYLGSKF